VDNPIGYKFYRKDGFYEVVGVVKDFYGSAQTFSSGNRAVAILNPDRWSTLAVKIRPDDPQTSVAAIKQVWETTLPGVYFDYSFLIDEVEKGYGELKGMTTIFMVIAILAISMGCLGIFGLVAFTAEQKTKEIGVRKVMGASIASIMKLLSREFVILIAISNAIALPLAYMLTNDILQYFVARIDVGVGIFLFTGSVAMVLALTTVSYQANKAARANPVETLRYE
jgi:putative ABC transport system permease protein